MRRKQASPPKQPTVALIVTNSVQTLLRPHLTTESAISTMSENWCLHEAKTSIAAKAAHCGTHSNKLSSNFDASTLDYRECYIYNERKLVLT